MAANNIFVEKVRDGLGISIFQSTGFDPFNEVINGNNDVAFSREGSR